jgi:hypothetical protein
MRLCVLSPNSSGDSEYRSAQRSVLTALGTHGDVHIVCLGDGADLLRPDQPITIHSLGAEQSERSVLRRDLLVSSYSKPSGGSEYERADTTEWPRESVDQILHRDTATFWREAASLVGSLQPDVVVVFDHRDRNVLAALSDVPDVPVILIPLVDTVATPDRVHFDVLFLRASGIVAFTDAERRTIARRTELPITVLALPVDHPIPTPNANQSAPPHVVVFTDAEVGDRLQRTAFANLVAFANPNLRVQVASRRAVVQWENGRRTSLPDLDGEGDLFSLVEGAVAVVDLHPGRLYAERTLQIHLMGVPTIVPSRSRAREYCEKGNGGLWFRNAGEMLWGVSAMLDPEVGPALGRQASTYVTEQHESRQRFAAQLLGACGLGGA